MVLTPEEILEQTKPMIGMETEPEPGRYPVEYEPIRRYCHMVNDDNPLYIDPKYARKTKYGDVVCPPFMITFYGDPGAWPPVDTRDPFIQKMPATPGTGHIVIGIDWEFYKTVKVGDVILVKHKLVDVYLKKIRLDPKARWIITDKIYTNQRGEKVALWRLTIIAFRSPEEVKAAGDAVEEKK